MMRGPNTRTRSLALVLLLICTGALSYETPPITIGSAGEASLVLQVDTTTAAFPAPSWTLTLEVGGSSSPPPVGPCAGGRNPITPGAGGQTPPAARVAPPRASGIALLGLLFAPANAPPGV